MSLTVTTVVRRRIGAAALGGVIFAGACATVSTQQEVALGADYSRQINQQLPLIRDAATVNYINQLGQRIAQANDPRGLRYTFYVVNSAQINAFAVPGGYIYVTRQLVSLMNNEAELAGVLGHEVGHVAARHSARRQEAAQRNQLLGVLGQVLSGVVFGNTALGQLGQQIAGTAPQLATLRYSRNQELEADQLGVNYLRRAGYDPRAMATVLQSLAAQNALDAQLQGRDATIPEWASTHPDPAGRVQNAVQLAAGATGTTNRDTFLTRIDGLIYGDDPKQGMIEGRTFIHPEFRLTFTAPQGFYMVNGTRAVSINGQSGQAQLSTGSYDGNLGNYIRSVFRALGGNQQTLAPASMEQTTVNGIPAAYGVARVNTGQQQVDVVVFAYEFSNSQAFHFAAITPAGQSGVFNPMFQSLRRITAAEAAQVIPRRIDVVTAGSGDSVATLAARMAYTNAQEQRFRVLNGLFGNAAVVPGQKYKIVVRAR